MAENVLIEASAGTGKTQALANRLIDLLSEGVNAREIVALTFSRAAAGEIFERFLSLLAEKAKTDAKAATALRETIAQQHLCSVGTLDSFLMRIVRSFPLELGLAHTAEMMDDWTAASERAETSFGILRRTDRAFARSFTEAFALAMNRANVRSFVETYQAFITAWHELFLAHPAESAWGDPGAIWGRSPAFLEADEAALAEAARRLEGLSGAKEWADFAAWIRDFRGSFAGLKGIVKKLLDEDLDPFVGATLEFSFKRKEFVFGGEQAAIIRGALQLAIGYALRRRLEEARGIRRLLDIFERAYAREVRNKGRLVFADVPRLISTLDESARLALEYRLDLRIRGWALDEFQDTSHEQWKALSGLIESARESDGEKSVFIVGDAKQAIYGWRNGDVEIFRGELGSGAYRLKELKKSYRSGAAVTDAVNRIFCGGRLKDELPSWESPEHETAKKNLDGFVHCVEAGGRRMEDFVEPVRNALKAVEPVRRGMAAAILVRANGFGEFLARELNRLGMKGVAWEGESAILDTPALLPFLDLVALADHPGNEQAYRHFAVTPLCALKYPQGLPPASQVSSEFARAFTTKGLVRTFRELRALLPADPVAAWSAACEERFTDMLRAAAKFELTLKPGTRMSDFMAFLQTQYKRNLAEPGMVKIMTYHRSKGLGFDYVVLPLYEWNGLWSDPDGPLVTDDWLLPPSIPKALQLVPGVREACAARRNRADQEEICNYYVAMTRAKQAMTIVLNPSAKGSTVRFSDIVRESLPGEIGNPRWYENFKAKTENPKTASSRPAPKRTPRTVRTRRLPSLAFQSGMRAGDLFAAETARADALARGTEVHKAFEQIEWFPAAAAKTELERALVKPADAVELWREKPYELLRNGTWESGCIDRAVFYQDGTVMISDYKTNRKKKDESDEEFGKRLAAMYASQMNAYRKAVALLTGIDEGKIKTQLLATAIQAAIKVV